MMSRYASGTGVPVERSKAEIEHVLHRYGADEFAYRTSPRLAQIAFKMHGSAYVVNLPLPNPNYPEFLRDPRGRERKPDVAVRFYQQACRERWRALKNYILATLEAVQSGIVTMEQALLSSMLLPDRQTVSKWLGPQLQELEQTGRMPRSLIEGPRQPRLPGSVVDLE